MNGALEEEKSVESCRRWKVQNGLVHEEAWRLLYIYREHGVDGLVQYTDDRSTARLIGSASAS